MPQPKVPLNSTAKRTKLLILSVGSKTVDETMKLFVAALLLLASPASGAFLVPSRSSSRGALFSKSYLDSLDDYSSYQQYQRENGIEPPIVERPYETVNNIEVHGVNESFDVNEPVPEQSTTTVEAAAPTAAVDMDSIIPPELLAPLNGWTPDTEDPLYGLPGSVPFFGFFDPLGLTSGDFALSDAKRLREAEVTHCRVAMAAFAGIVVGESVEGVFKLTGPAIYHMDQLPNTAEYAFFAFAAALEFYRMKVGWVSPNFLDGRTLFALKNDYYPGDVGFDPFGLKPSNPKEYDAMQCRELNNGRLAMFAVVLMTMDESVTGAPVFQQLIPPICK